MRYFLDMHFDFDMYLEFEIIDFFLIFFLVIYFLIAPPLLLHPVVNISESLFSFSLSFFFSKTGVCRTKKIVS